MQPMWQSEITQKYRPLGGYGLLCAQAFLYHEYIKYDMQPTQFKITIIILDHTIN